MFSIAHAVAWNTHPPSSSSSSLAHALGFAPAADDSAYIDIQPHSSDDAVFRLPPLPAMAVLIPPLPPLPQQAQRREVKPEPAEPTLHAQGLVYVFEHARRTEDGSVSFDLCDEESLLARGGAVAPEAEAGVASAPKRGMKAMMGVFRVDPFTTGPRVVEDCDGDGDGDGEEDDPGASFEFQMEMDMDVSVTGRQRDAEAHAHTQHVPHDPRPALLPFISAASCPASPTASSSPASQQMQMDHPTQHPHSRPSTAASSRSASSFAPAPSASVNTEGAKKKPKKVKMHACDVCHKEFPRPSGLQTHMNVHSGAKPYKCPVPGCSKRFGVRSNATRHLRVHQRQQAHAASQQHRPSAASIASSSAATTMDSWLDLPADVLRPTPADVLAAHHPHPHPHQQQQQRWVPDSLQHLSNALELPAALRGPRVEGVGVGIDAGPGHSANEWPYHPSQQWASKLPGPGPLRQQWAAPSHAWVGA